MTGLGRWGNGDVEVGLTSLDELPYVMGLVRQSFERPDGQPGRQLSQRPCLEHHEHEISSGTRMQKFDATRPKHQSADLTAENSAKLKALFPEVFTEGKEAAINVDVLKELWSAARWTTRREIRPNWHGKRRARQLALTPCTGTLRPCPEESVDWDTTQNLMIEGDNLEVLKLLQKSYAGKVKLIYIDPPYNTGNDFVYPDNFQDNIKNYLELTGQMRAARKISSNAEASGRFHTDWLNMMYPRLKLARNLLREDGVIFISIDDVEVDNLKKVCCEVFGEEAFVGILSVLVNPRGRSPRQIHRTDTRQHSGVRKGP